MLSRVAMRRCDVGKAVQDGPDWFVDTSTRPDGDWLSVSGGDLSQMFPLHLLVKSDGIVQSVSKKMYSFMPGSGVDNPSLFDRFSITGDSPVTCIGDLRSCRGRELVLSPLRYPVVQLRTTVFEVGVDSLLLVIDPDADGVKQLADCDGRAEKPEGRPARTSEERLVAHLLGTTGVTVSYCHRSEGIERRNHGAELPPLLSSALESGIYNTDGIRGLLARPSFASAFHVREVVDHESGGDATAFEIRSPAGGSWLLRLVEFCDGGNALVCRDTSRVREVERNLFHAQKVESVGLLTSGVAHDFNNLLTIISSGLHLLSVKERESQRVIDAIRVAADRSAALVDQLLRLAEHEASEDGHTIVAETLATLSEILPSTLGPDVSLHMVDQTKATVVANSDLLESALLNLVVNARDAMPRGGHIDVRTRLISREEAAAQGLSRRQRYCAIEIVDEGDGIEPQHLERVFDPFFTTKSAGSGTGLGLCMVKDFAERSGGKVTASSNAEVGATMVLFLECADPEVGGSSRAPEHDQVWGDADLCSSRTDSEASGLLGGKSVLIIDDEVDLAWTVSSLVACLGGRPSVVNGVTEAQRFLEQHQVSPPDVVLTDYYMVDGTGSDVLALCSRLCPHASVHLMSGNIDLRAPNGDVSGQVLKKPFTVEALAETLAG